MLKYFKGLDLNESALADDVWQFRHRHFVERFRWEALRKPNGREIDAFDNDDAVHLVLEHKGTVVGYSRLLPTDKPHLLSDVYPEIAAGFAYQTGPQIFEWTRCVAEPDVFMHGVTAAHMLQTGVLEFCLTVGIEALVVETHPKLVQVLVSHQWNVTPLAAPMVYDGALVLPINAVPTSAALASHHRSAGINGSVLDLAADAVNPIDGSIVNPFVEHAHVEEVVEVHYG